MPHYYFDINDVPDEDGRQLDGIGEAHVVARQLLAADLVRTIVNTGYHKSWSCLVREKGNGTTVRIIMTLLVEDMTSPAGGNLLFRPT